MSSYQQSPDLSWGTGAPTGLRAAASFCKDSVVRVGRRPHPLSGAVAQMGERLHGMQEVTGSIPVSSTRYPLFLARS